MNPNDPKYSKIYPNDELLLEEVTDYEIYRYYIGEFKIGKAFTSPLYKDDHPSFGIFKSKKVPGRLFFKDHRGPSGDSITLVTLLFNCSYKEAIEKIIIDFRLEDKFIIQSDAKQLKPVEYRIEKSDRKNYLPSSMDLKITSRKWQKYDAAFWSQFGISINTLFLFNVIPIKYYWMYGKPYRADKYAYAYKEYKDNELNYKVYQPYREAKNHKFLNGFLDGTFSGWNLLPEHTDLIIITKSAKDTMFLYEHGYHVISPQGEGYTFKKQVVDILKLKSNKIITFYDHDNAGINAAKRNREEFGFEFVTTCSLENKDITDFYKKFGLKKTLELLKIIF